jgi:hypothetical protein
MYSQNTGQPVSIFSGGCAAAFGLIGTFGTSSADITLFLCDDLRIVAVVS